jgi:hypothetical protein
MRARERERGGVRNEGEGERLVESEAAGERVSGRVRVRVVGKGRRSEWVREGHREGM